MPRMSLEGRLEKLEKELKTDTSLTDYNKLRIDYLMTQVMFGFGGTNEPTSEQQLYEWRVKLGKKSWDKLMKEFSQRELAAKNNPKKLYWKGLVNI